MFERDDVLELYGKTLSDVAGLLETVQDYVIGSSDFDELDDYTKGSGLIWLGWTMGALTASKAMLFGEDALMDEEKELLDKFDDDINETITFHASNLKQEDEFMDILKGNDKIENNNGK